MLLDSGIGGLSEKIGDLTKTGFNLTTKYQPSKLYARPKYIPHRPLNAVSGGGPYRFKIGGPNSTDLIKLDLLRLMVKFKVVNKKDKSNLDPNAPVSLVNSLIHSLFTNVSCMLNNIPISDHTKNYNYKSYIQQLYSFSSGVKNNNLGCEFFTKDDTVM